MPLYFVFAVRCHAVSNIPGRLPSIEFGLSKCVDDRGWHMLGTINLTSFRQIRQSL